MQSNHKFYGFHAFSPSASVSEQHSRFYSLVKSAVPMLDTKVWWAMPGAFQAVLHERSTKPRQAVGLCQAMEGCCLRASFGPSLNQSARFCGQHKVLFRISSEITYDVLITFCRWPAT